MNKNITKNKGERGGGMDIFTKSRDNNGEKAQKTAATSDRQSRMRLLFLVV